MLLAVSLRLRYGGALCLWRGSGDAPDLAPSRTRARRSRRSPHRGPTVCHSARRADSARYYFNFARAHFAKERILLRTHWKIILLGIIVQYVHSIATKVAYYIHVQREPLYDLGFAVFPALTKKWQIISEIMFFSYFISTLSWMFTPFFYTQSRPVYTVVMFSRFLSVCAAAQCLRCVSFLVTSLPGPNYHCRPTSLDYKPPRNPKEIFFNLDAFYGCGDLVFSSHTTFVLLCALTYSRYSDHGIWWKRLAWVCVVIFGGMVVAARKHYTLDIIVAWYTVPLLWIAFERYFPDQIPQELMDGAVDDVERKEKEAV